MIEDVVWDVVVVGAGPAGSAAALGALHQRPDAKVLLLDRADFPRDKACGDGIAPHVLDVLSEVGVTDLLADWKPVRSLALEHLGTSVVREMARAAWVVPRVVFDKRLVEAARTAGAEFRRHRARNIEWSNGLIEVDAKYRCRVLVAADGANSALRRRVGVVPAKRTAIAIRGYAPTTELWAGRQAIVFGAAHQPSYAWAFDRGDGMTNVGYGEVLKSDTKGLTRKAMLDRLDELLPGSTTIGDGWLAHHLPLSSWTWTHPSGPLLLTGDAAGLINPMTGEGIYYAVATGVLAGKTAITRIDRHDAQSAGSAYRTAVRRLLGRHLKHTTVASRLSAHGWVVDAGIRAATSDQGVFDDLVEIGLGRGRLTRPLIASLAKQTWHRPTPRRIRS